MEEETESYKKMIRTNITFRNKTNLAQRINRLLEANDLEGFLAQKKVLIKAQELLGFELVLPENVSDPFYLVGTMTK